MAYKVISKQIRLSWRGDGLLVFHAMPERREPSIYTWAWVVEQIIWPRRRLTIR